MNSFVETRNTAIDATAIREAMESACKRIAPTWPLDEFIAVNPYWGFVGDDIRTAARQLESNSGSRMLMPRSYYRDQWKAGSFCAEDLHHALDHSGVNLTISELLSELNGEPKALPRIPLATRVADSRRDLLHGMSITDFVTHNMSQHCASYFDHCQSSWETQHKTDLYHSWLHHAMTDRSPRLLMGIPGVRPYARSLPSAPFDMIVQALQTLPVPQAELESYLAALLMSMNGWASWCAYERWQAQLSQNEDDHIVQLLAIRLAWEHFAYLHLLDAQGLVGWKDAWNAISAWKATANHPHSADWIFQEALEMAYQQRLCRSLSAGLQASPPDSTGIAAAQAVFCIDVRSEVFRRAFEACSPTIDTLGFAGFFGLPISYTALGRQTARPQLPGLLAPKLCVTDSTGSSQLDQQLNTQRRRNLYLKSTWKDFRSAATSTFTFVESCGLFFGGSLIKNTLPRLNRFLTQKRNPGGNPSSLRPCIVTASTDASSTPDDLCDLVAGILTNMSLTQRFARLLVLVGHGSETENNPHAAGLDCGACGGHSGEVNARVLASLLNDPAIRAGLFQRGITIPSTTHALGALHNTTTDEVTIFDAETAPQTHAADLAQLQQWFRQAGHRARRERAASVGIRENDSTSSDELLRLFQRRSHDWSQVRPEWGLANNAAFLIAPRSRSRALDLQSRVFLHEYQSASDPAGAVLEAIMTAPLLVTNWINMQYYASTVDNRLYGSGNKVLHNVVGGRLGIFEGNGGDLRIGLPLQSLHDGQTLRHTPLRLNVFIEAEEGVIDTILTKHEVVRNLVDNAWIHLLQIRPGSGAISRYRKGRWMPVDGDNLTPGHSAERISEESYA